MHSNLGLTKSFRNARFGQSKLGITDVCMYLCMCMYVYVCMCMYA